MRRRALIMAVVWSVCWLVLGCESEPEFTDPGARLEYRIRKKLGDKIKSYKVRQFSGQWLVFLESN